MGEGKALLPVRVPAEAQAVTQVPVTKEEGAKDPSSQEGVQQPKAVLWEEVAADQTSTTTGAQASEQAIVQVQSLLPQGQAEGTAEAAAAATNGLAIPTGHGVQMVLTVGQRDTGKQAAAGIVEHGRLRQIGKPAARVVLALAGTSLTVAAAVAVANALSRTAVREEKAMATLRIGAKKGPHSQAGKLLVADGAAPAETDKVGMAQRMTLLLRRPLSLRSSLRNILRSSRPSTRRRTRPSTCRRRLLRRSRPSMCRRNRRRPEQKTPRSRDGQRWG